MLHILNFKKIVFLFSLLFFVFAFFNSSCTANKKNNLGKANRLINEQSPYLLQHAHNPVDWYPWGDEAFEKAKNENKPIFLSIGYSTCHWCHVMEEKCFKDKQVAVLLNKYFVSIKVDREDRPDIDQIYMKFAVEVTGHGGWPLNVFLTPDRKPFFAVPGFIPKYNTPVQEGLMSMLPRLANIWKKDREKIVKSSIKIHKFLQAEAKLTKGTILTEAVLKKAYKNLARFFDKKYGGFGKGPKFPKSQDLLFLTRYAHRYNDKKAFYMVEKTLDEMRKGGIYDHIAFGFHRYSVTQDWKIPHFEKMLYDQANISMAYTEAYHYSKKEKFKTTAKEIFSYIKNEMTSKEGGFYSAQDADSEGKEGKYYLWTEKELGEILSQKEYNIFTTVFNTEALGNKPKEISELKDFVNVLYKTKTLKAYAQELNIKEEKLSQTLEKIRLKLLKVRKKRIPPFKDDKIMTDWNGLMIASLAKAARVFDDPDLKEAAEKACGFIMDKMIRKDKRLYHRFRKGKASLNAHLQDYAFFIYALIELYETTFKVKYLKTALELQDVMIKHFWDPKDGGFYFSDESDKSLIIRKKDIEDRAIPSGNSIGMMNLLRLSSMTGNLDYEKKAFAISKAFSKKVNARTPEFSQLLLAVDFNVGPSYEVVIAGKPGSEDLKKMIKALRQAYHPNKIVLFRPEEDSPEILKPAPFIKYQKAQNNKATAYVCSHFICKQPTNSIKKMLELLKK